MKTQISADKANDLLIVLREELKELRSLKEDLLETARSIHREVLENRSKWSKFWDANPTVHECNRIVIKTLYTRDKVRHWGSTYINDVLFLGNKIAKNNEYDEIVKDLSKLETIIHQLNACALIGDPIYLSGDEAKAIAEYL